MTGKKHPRHMENTGMRVHDKSFWRLSASERIELIWKHVADTLNGSIYSKNQQATAVTIYAPPSVKYNYSVKIIHDSVYKRFNAVDSEVWKKIQALPGRFDRDSYTGVDVSISPAITQTVDILILRRYPVRVETIDDTTCISTIAVDDTVIQVRHACMIPHRIQQVVNGLNQLYPRPQH